jgi:hypothetical protein
MNISTDQKESTISLQKQLEIERELQSLSVITLSIEKELERWFQFSKRLHQESKELGDLVYFCSTIEQNISDLCK